MALGLRFALALLSPPVAPPQTEEIASAKPEEQRSDDAEPDGVEPDSRTEGDGSSRGPRTKRPRPAAPRPSAPEDAPATRRIQVGRVQPESADRGRASTYVTRQQLEERMPRSTPDALRFEPGVFIQQTAHGQASPYIRGLTGQQTVIMFDGIRVNNSTFRQGPNQYLFTVDARTLDHIEIVRGGTSTRWGSDALGGAILLFPLEVMLERGKKPVAVHGLGAFRTGTADAELGGRAQVAVAYRDVVGFMGGVGYRTVGQLRSGGRIREPATGDVQKVPPAFEADGKTQKGTGFNELTADLRARWQPRRHHSLGVAYYDYRGFDIPRTDQCPPPTAPEDECLTYNEQFRTLVYTDYRYADGHGLLESARATVSYQRQHQDSDLDRGYPSPTHILGVDDVHTIGTSFTAKLNPLTPAPWAKFGVEFGADGYYDRIGSELHTLFESSNPERPDQRHKGPRGHYMDGSHYWTSGIWMQTFADLTDVVHLRAGGRLAFVYARAPGQEETTSPNIDKRWFAASGGAGMIVDALPWLSFFYNADQGFRAPNLDDMTARNQTGPGFQYGSADLVPERALTLETGLRATRSWLDFSAWTYRTSIRDLVGRLPRRIEDCPVGDPGGCMGSWTTFQVANFEGLTRIYGVEAVLSLDLPLGFGIRGMFAWAKGDATNPLGTGRERNLELPLSRVPPINGAGEIGWRSKFGFSCAGVVQWALEQSRLALQDIQDPRIPAGGTPGYAVFDVRLTYRLDPYIFVNLVVHNLGDSPWRTHGSSINGPGRGVLFETRFGF